MAHCNPQIVLTRLKNLKELVRRRTLGDACLLEARVAVTDAPVPYARRTTLDYNPVQEGDTWGRTWQSGWFELTGTVPPSWAGRYVVARLDFGGEALLFDDTGCPALGLTDGSVFDLKCGKDIVHLFPEARGGETVRLWVEAAANRLQGVERVPDPEFLEDPGRLHGHHRGRVKAMRLHAFRADHWHLHLDLEVLLDLYEDLPPESRRKKTLLHALNAAATAYDHGGATAARLALRPALELPADPAAMRLTGVGHGHIDTGWLWAVRETIRKSARTFSSALDLIDRYPDYTFGASQPAHYRMVKEHYPRLYEKIRSAVAAGRWELQGGMWVEADCNLIGGESMIRQFLHGKRFFREEFGRDVRNLWLPDVFGYSAQLPQIMLKAGCPVLLTQKISWSKYTVFPHHTFLWRGLDGSEVLAHFLPENTYIGRVLPSQLRQAEASYREAALCDEAVSLFGVGDGGGGPQEAHIERARRVADLNGVPRFAMGPAQPVLDRLYDRRDVLDAWTGELYLELHRGTYTVQARIKRLHRRLEEALRACEDACVRAGPDRYPRAALDALWKMTLLNQFHDILPGSCIHTVAETAERELQDGIARCADLTQAALGASEKPDTLGLINPSSTPFDDAVPLPDGWRGARHNGRTLPVQIEAGQAWARLAVAPRATVLLCRSDGGAAVETAETRVLENELVRYRFDADLRLVEAVDKRVNRSLLPADRAGNVISLYEDRAHAWDAWDMDDYYRASRLAQARATAPPESFNGPVAAGLRATLAVGSSTLRQTVRLRPGSARLDFVTEAEWTESHKMLRVAFPTTVDVDQASFEIQYGIIRRPARRNRTEDVARFEVCGHRFADLSRDDWGVALLNDCKYGYRVVDGVLDLNLLRSPTHPDPEADRGRHRFTYSLLPHPGGPAGIDTIRTEAAMLNQGLTRVPGATRLPPLPVSLAGEGLELAAVKMAEAENALIVRIVECRGLPARGRLNAPGYTVQPVTLMEQPPDGAPQPVAGPVDIALAPFEIATFRLTPSAEGPARDQNVSGPAPTR
ncbi:MAG: alpha-mannosidase [Lentisphaerae bacterium]|nr:alpha-mannosidase [Lentisphaerota bacterium]